MSFVDVQLLHKFGGHKDCLYAMSAGPDSQGFFTSGADALVVKWDLRQPDQGQLVAKVSNTVYALCYLPAFNTLVVGQNFEGIHLIDLNTNKEIRSVKLTDKAIFDIQYAEGKLWVATGGGEIIVVDYNSFARVNNQVLSTEYCRCLALNPSDPTEISAGFSDNVIRILDKDTLQVRQELAAHTNSVFCLTYDQKGQYLLSGSRDAHLRFWHAGKRYEAEKPVVAHMFTINHVAFSPSGKYFATCSKDKSVKVWHSQKRQLLKVIDKARHAGHGTSVNKLLWLDDSHLVSCSDDRTISIWELRFNI